MPRARRPMVRAKTLFPPVAAHSPIDHRLLEEENPRKRTKLVAGLQNPLGNNRRTSPVSQKSTPLDASSPSHVSSMENHPTPVVPKRKRSSACLVGKPSPFPKKKSLLPPRQQKIVSVAVPVIVLKTTVPLKPPADSTPSAQVPESDDEEVVVVKDTNTPKPRRSGRTQALTNFPIMPIAKRRSVAKTSRRTPIAAEKSGAAEKSPAKRVTGKGRNRAKTMTAVPSQREKSVEVIENPTDTAVGMTQKPSKRTAKAKAPPLETAAIPSLKTATAKGPPLETAAISKLKNKRDAELVSNSPGRTVAGVIESPSKKREVVKRGTRPIAEIQAPRAVANNSVRAAPSPLNIAQTHQNPPKSSAAAKLRMRATTVMDVPCDLDSDAKIVPVVKGPSKVFKLRSRATTIFPVASAVLNAPKLNVSDIMNMELSLNPPKSMDTRPVKITKGTTIKTKNTVPVVTANSGHVPESTKTSAVIVPKMPKQVARKTALTQKVKVAMPPVPEKIDAAIVTPNRKRTLRGTTQAVSQATESVVAQRKSQAAERKTKQKRITFADQPEDSVVKVDEPEPVKKKAGRVNCRKSGAIRSQRIKERDDDTDDGIERSATSIAARVVVRQRNTKLYADFTNSVSLAPKAKKARRKVTAQTKPKAIKEKKPPKRLETKAKPITDKRKNLKARVNNDQPDPSSSIESERERPVRLSAEGIQRTKSGFLKCAVNHVIAKQYRIVAKLGTGTFGQVVKVQNVLAPTSRALAMKIVQQGHDEAARLEANMLERVGRMTGQGRNLFVQLYDQFMYHQHHCMLFETLGRSVYSVLEENYFHPFQLDQVRDISYQMCLAVKFLRKNNIIHTDLKPENLLFVDPRNGCDYLESFIPDKHGIVVMQDCRIKVIDFGGAIFNAEHHGTTVTTRHYRPPEVVLRKGWSFPLDMWSVGCIMYELYIGKALFSTEQDAEHLAIMEKCLGKLPRSMTNGSEFYNARGTLKWHTMRTKTKGHDYVKHCCSSIDSQMREQDIFNVSVQSCFTLFKKMLEYEPERRIKARHAVNDVYFQDVDPAILSACEE